MPKLTIDLSGRGGLVERHQGDLNDTSAKPNLRYLGAEGQYADGVFNPFKKYGYMSPANGTFTSLTGTIAAPINSIQYDAEDDIVYLSEEGTNILKLGGMDDTSLANHLTISTGTIKDMILYEVNGNKALVYAIDSGTATGGMYVGFDTLESGVGIATLKIDIEEVGLTPQGGFSFDGGNDSITLSNPVFYAAQSVLSTNLSTLTFDSVTFRMRRAAGSGGYNLHVEVHTNATASAGLYTAKGAWADATAYVVNDTVTHGGSTWQCILAHTSSAATNEPGVGSSYLSRWNLFGSPSGTVVATSSNVSAATVPVGTSSEHTDILFEFASEVTLTTATTYWFVIKENGSSMTSSDDIELVRSDNSNNPYTGAIGAKAFLNAATDFWTQVDGATEESLEMTILDSRIDNWSSEVATGAFDVETGLDTYLYPADNGLVYWFTGKNVHTVDGSVTGGFSGRVNENVLSFPTYISVADVAETRSRMYIGVQTSNVTSTTDPRYYTANRSGIYVWDRRSTVLGGTDFYPTPGAQEIKKLFTSSDGSVKAITVGGTGFTEIRAASGNQFAVIQTFERNGFPNRRGVSEINGLSVWLGKNGIFYAYGSVAPGEKDRLYKIGTMAGEANAGLVTGPIFVGNENSASPQTAVLFGWSDEDPSYNVQKWFPNGEGTIASVAQVGNQGDVTTMLLPLPSFSTVKYINIFGIPTTTSSADTIATVKIYFNQSTTAWATKTITKADMNKGYKEIPVNKQNINFMQVEIEWSTTETLGADTFYPMYAEVEVSDVETGGRQKA